MKIDVKYDSEYIYINVICKNILNIVKYFYVIIVCV